MTQASAKAVRNAHAGARGAPAGAHGAPARNQISRSMPKENGPSPGNVQESFPFFSFCLTISTHSSWCSWL